MNYQKEMEEILSKIQDRKPVPKLLLHSCCGPCSTAVLERLSEYFQITIFFYNPNIYPEEEYAKRIIEQQGVLRQISAKHPILFLAGSYEVERFEEIAKGREDLKEGGERCHHCYRFRLEEAAKMAKEGGFDFFTTTLSISPMKSAQVLNKIGEEVGKEYGVSYLPSDFKKKNGYKRSIELSKDLGLYRQDYCGCRFSIRR